MKIYHNPVGKQIMIQRSHLKGNINALNNIFDIVHVYNVCLSTAAGRSNDLRVKGPVFNPRPGKTYNLCSD